MTSTCRKAFRSLRACRKDALVKALASTLRGRPVMVSYYREIARTCGHDANLLAGKIS